MKWTVVFHPAFRSELKVLPTPVYDKLLSFALLLEEYGPSLGRPTVDTLNGSRHPNMKELRVGAGSRAGGGAGGVWRVAFAFDPDRQAILLVAGDKSKVERRRFYERLIREADERFDSYLESKGGQSRQNP